MKKEDWMKFAEALVDGNLKQDMGSFDLNDPETYKQYLKDGVQNAKAAYKQAIINLSSMNTDNLAIDDNFAKYKDYVDNYQRVRDKYNNALDVAKGFFNADELDAEIKISLHEAERLYDVRLAAAGVGTDREKKLVDWQEIETLVEHSLSSDDLDQYHRYQKSLEPSEDISNRVTPSETTEEDQSVSDVEAYERAHDTYLRALKTLGNLASSVWLTSDFSNIENRVSDVVMAQRTFWALKEPQAPLNLTEDFTLEDAKNLHKVLEFLEDANLSYAREFDRDSLNNEIKDFLTLSEWAEYRDFVKSYQKTKTTKPETEEVNSYNAPDSSKEKVFNDLLSNIKECNKYLLELLNSNSNNIEQICANLGEAYRKVEPCFNEAKKIFPDEMVDEYHEELAKFDEKEKITLTAAKALYDVLVNTKESGKLDFFDGSNAFTKKDDEIFDKLISYIYNVIDIDDRKAYEDYIKDYVKSHAPLEHTAEPIKDETPKLSEDDIQKLKADIIDTLKEVNVSLLALKEFANCDLTNDENLQKYKVAAKACNDAFYLHNSKLQQAQILPDEQYIPMMDEVENSIENFEDSAQITLADAKKIYDVQYNVTNSAIDDKIKNIIAWNGVNDHISWTFGKNKNLSDEYQSYMDNYVQNPKPSQPNPTPQETFAAQPIKTQAFTAPTPDIQTKLDTFRNNYKIIIDKIIGTIKDLKETERQINENVDLIDNAELSNSNTSNLIGLTKQAMQYETIILTSQRNLIEQEISIYREYPVYYAKTDTQLVPKIDELNNTMMTLKSNDKVEDFYQKYISRINKVVEKINALSPEQTAERKQLEELIVSFKGLMNHRLMKEVKFDQKFQIKDFLEEQQRKNIKVEQIKEAEFTETPRVEESDLNEPDPIIESNPKSTDDDKTPKSEQDSKSEIEPEEVLFDNKDSEPDQAPESKSDDLGQKSESEVNKPTKETETPEPDQENPERTSKPEKKVNENSDESLNENKLPKTEPTIKKFYENLSNVIIDGYKSAYASGTTADFAEYFSTAFNGIIENLAKAYPNRVVKVGSEPNRYAWKESEDKQTEISFVEFARYFTSSYKAGRDKKLYEEFASDASKVTIKQNVLNTRTPQKVTAANATIVNAVLSSRVQNPDEKLIFETVEEVGPEKVSRTILIKKALKDKIQENGYKIRFNTEANQFAGINNTAQGDLQYKITQSVDDENKTILSVVDANDKPVYTIELNYDVEMVKNKLHM